MWLTLFTAIISVWWKYYITVCHWASVPKSEINDITLVAWSLTWWKYLHHCYKSGFFLPYPLKAAVMYLPALHYAGQWENPPILSTVSEENHTALHFVMSLNSQWSISMGASVLLYNLIMVFWSVFRAMPHTFFFLFTFSASSLQHLTLPLLPPSSQSEWKSLSHVWLFVTPWTI